MSFFYNLNNKLNAIRDLPSTTHGQLNERDMSRAAKGYEKYGKEGMEALAKAGRDGKALDPVRKKYDKYDESVEEAYAPSPGNIYDPYGDNASPEQHKAYQDELNLYKTPGAHPGLASKGMSRAQGVHDRLHNVLAKKSKGVAEEGLGDMARKVGGAVKKVAGKALDTLGHGSDADSIRDLQKKMGLPQTGMKPGSEPNPKVVKEKMSPEKAKSFAALAEPKDKITFADKIAGAKKEVDEMLGDVAAEAMKSALSGHSTKSLKAASSKDANADKKSGVSPQYSTQQVKGELKRRGEKVASEAEDNSPFTAHKRPRVEKPAVGTITRGSKHDVEEIPGGRRVTRRVDPAGISVGADDDKPADGEKRGRGRPKGPAKAPERVTGGATKHKGGRKMTKEGAGPDDIAVLERLMDEAFADGNNALGNALQGVLEKMDGGEKQVDEKAVSKKQQRFMGMVHAAQKGEKPASKEVAKTAKSMGKKDAEDFAATKHKGLPEKKKPEGKKKEKTEETADSTPSKGGIKFGGGIYDSMNRELENMIKESMARLDESMSINMSMNNDGDMHGGASKSLTVTATDDDAMKLSELLRSAGLGGGDSEGYGGGGYKSACGCGQPDCSCGDDELDEVSMNQPDYPTKEETSADPFQYSGGLNKPKATGQTTTPVIASQDDRQESYAEAEEDALHRMMEMAGVKKKEVDEEKTDEGNKFTGNLAKARAAGKKEADLDGDGDMEKVRESIFDLTNQWRAYKG